MTPSPPGVRTANLLGYLGLIPFFAAAAVMWAGPRRIEPQLFFFAPIVLLIYAATIASFLGGVRWGVEAARAGDRARCSWLPRSLRSWRPRL